MPECQIILGLSNISFGLNPPARQVLNSVFLDHALKRGLTGAIVHVSKIMPLHKIPPEEVRVAEDLIFDRRREGYDPLQAFIALFEDRDARGQREEGPAGTVEERLKQRIVDGDRQGLEDDLDLAMASYKPLDIINDILLDGMKMVGELFGAGKMQLPFVLQSAETMKAAVGYLEPHMERVEGQEKGTIVLATVKGDVHDIGKNLVDIILTNNGYRVVNLGIKQPIAAILDAAAAQQADAVGMSGLLVKSTVVMRENLEEMTPAGAQPAGDARRRRADPALCRGGLRQGLCHRPRRLCPRRLRRARADGQDRHRPVRRASRRGPGEEARAARSSQSRKLGRAADAAPIAPGRCRGDPPAPRRADPRRAGAAAALLGPAHDRAGAGQGDRALSQRAHALPIPMGLPQRRQEPRRIPRMGARTSCGRSCTRILEIAIREDILVPQAAYGYWPCAAEGNDRDPVRRGWRARAGALLLPAPEQGRRAVHRRFLPRCRPVASAT